jgi:serine/threonine-protein kinase
MTINNLPQPNALLKDGDVVQLGATRIRFDIMPGAVDNCCCQCGCDLSGLVDRDGRALDFIGTAYHICERHIEINSIETIGKYALCGLIGEGAEGRVYRAFDKSTARLFALKRLRDRESKEMLARLQIQLEQLKPLRHVNIIRYVEDGVDDVGVPYLVTEYTPDGSLEGFSRNWGGQIPVDLAVEIFAAVLDGLKYIHSKGLFHRDLKPHNILLRAKKDQLIGIRHIPKITDFGLLKKIGAATITRPGVAYGTLAFTAPEQMTSFRDARERADIYSLGASLYFVLTGRLPIDLPADDESVALIRSAIEDERIPILLRNPASQSIPPRLAAVIDRACNRNPALRFESAEAFQEALYSAL